MAALGHYASLWLHDLLLVLAAALAVSALAGVANVVSDDPGLHWPALGLGTVLGIVAFPFLCAGGWIVQAIRWHSFARAFVALLAVVPGAFLGMAAIFLGALVVHILLAGALRTAKGFSCS